jgi:hypothetical protein
VSPFAEKIKKAISGVVTEEAAVLAGYSRDASLFEVSPQTVVFPKDVSDLKALVNLVRKENAA